MDLVTNVRNVFTQISDEIEKSHRLIEDVSVIAVTKYVDSDIASQLVKAGVRHIGENRVEQFLDKYSKLNSPEITWHLIGTLQRRKVKDVINLVDYFHALDSIKLAQEIQKRAEHVINCFVQVNISGEASKHGFTVEELMESLPILETFDKINIVGVMTMAPLEASEEEVSLIFAEAKSLQEKLQKLQLKNMPFTELSMGMSGDYQLAIKNGATFIRIGSAFFE